MPRRVEGDLSEEEYTRQRGAWERFASALESHKERNNLTSRTYLFWTVIQLHSDSDVKDVSVVVLTPFSTFKSDKPEIITILLEDSDNDNEVVYSSAMFSAKFKWKKDKPVALETEDIIRPELQPFITDISTVLDQLGKKAEQPEETLNY